MLEKLPPSWNDIKNYLKHKHHIMKIKGLVIRPTIKEDNNNTRNKSRKSLKIIGVNIVEEAPIKGKKSNKHKSNKTRRNSRATVTLVVRMVIRLLSVVLQERTKTKVKQKF